MISNWGDRKHNNRHLYTNFDSVASHLELVILSRKSRISEHAQSGVVEYFFSFVNRNQFKFARSPFSPGYGCNALKTSNLLRNNQFDVTSFLGPFAVSVSISFLN